MGVFLPPVDMDFPLPPGLMLDDIEASLCGTATPEQHARYCAAMDDPNSELNHMLNYVRSNDRLEALAQRVIRSHIQETMTPDEQRNG